MKTIQIFTRKTILFPTLFGWILLNSLIVVCFCIFIETVQPFLALSKPNDSDILLVEGWIPDYCLEEVYQIYKTRPIHKVIITGGPLEQGSYICNHKNFADVAASSLKVMGIPDSILITVPSQRVKRDRTLASALALKKMLQSSNFKINSMEIITLGVHSRRSLLLFKKALPYGIKIGILSIQDKDYQPSSWFASSYGFKTVLIEFISYLYTIAPIHNI